ncbi:hypothetical protein PVK06_004865 [Gossypium arboreum]|uniref:Uncharacterized protein n=1 Tax=Gossypium arboreum TaxID=29729 RepID=A0ABR0QT39_GOSAR|nr:hypothetical protein PVK06_004865 [Gossypium arboreum]
MNALAMIISKLIVLTLLRRKTRVYVLREGDENTSSNSNFDKDQVNNFVIFTLSVVSGFEAEIDNDFDEGSDREFMNTYKTMLSKWKQVCELNNYLPQENAQKKEENKKLIKNKINEVKAFMKIIREFAINSWSKRLLSYGGKEIFIESILQSLLIYAPGGTLEDMQ